MARKRLAVGNFPTHLFSASRFASSRDDPGGEFRPREAGGTCWRQTLDVWRTCPPDIRNKIQTSDHGIAAKSRLQPGALWLSLVT